MRVVHAAPEVEIQVRQQVDLAEQHERGAPEHVRIFERLVLAFGYRQQHHLVRLAQVEGGGTYEIAHILYHQDAVPRRVQLRERVPDHMRIEMAALAGVDLHRARAGCADALGIVAGLLIAFDHADQVALAQRPYRLHQQRRLARPGTGDQIEREYAALGQGFAVVRGVTVVFCQNVLLDLEHARRRQAGRMRVRRRGFVPVAVGLMCVAVRPGRRKAHDHEHGCAARPRRAAARDRLPRPRC